LKNIKQQNSYFSYVHNNKVLVIPRFGVFSPQDYFSKIFLSFHCFHKIKASHLFGTKQGSNEIFQ
jgi:hypothetical protein